MRPRRAAGLRGACVVCVVCVACAVLASAPLGCSCESSERAEQRRAVLAPRDLDRQRREAQEKTRLYDERGQLVPSDIKVAGVFLPRGLKQILVREREWYFDAALPLPKLQAYFSACFASYDVKQPRNDTVEFLRGVPKDTPDAPFVLVRFSRAAHDKSLARVYIRQAEARPSFYMTEEQARARLAEKLKTAD
jgi:hypothetical protein